MRDHDKSVAHEDSVASNSTDPMYLSAEAALEIDELWAGVREAVPSFAALVQALRTPAPSPSFEGHSSVSFLHDVRAYTIIRDALGERVRKANDFEEFRHLVETFLDGLQAGVEKHDQKVLGEAKDFCLSLGSSLIRKQMQETYFNREQSDSRYISYVALS